MTKPANDLRKQLLNWTLTHSGAEFRDYLGMSRIAECPRLLYDELLYGRDWSTAAHLLCYQGYLHERDVLARLQAMNGHQLGPGRQFSDFGGRFRGHSDAEWDGDLLEIKSTVSQDLDRIRENKHLSVRHFWQIQTYMHYGRYARALVVYVARDTGYLYVAQIRYLEHIAERARLKASVILEAIDHKEPPDCECGHCKQIDTCTALRCKCSATHKISPGKKGGYHEHQNY